MILSSTSLFLVRYKTVYAVTISNEVVGYINNKVAFQKRINDEITGTNNNIAFVAFEQLPEYKLELVNKKTKTNEDEILAMLKQNAEITYKYYAVTLDNDTKAYLNSYMSAARPELSDFSKQFLSSNDTNNFTTKPELSNITRAYLFSQNDTNNEK